MKTSFCADLAGQVPRLRPGLTALFIAASLALPVTAPAQAEEMDTLVDTGNRLAALLRAGRTVVSANQALVNDPAIGDKGLTPDVFMTQVTEAYTKTHGEPPLTDDLSPLQTRLTEAQLAAMEAVVTDSQDLINVEGMGFKGFIPAVFARLVNERFGQSVGDLASVKVTAPPDLVRNRTARPDTWEADVIATKFGATDHAKGDPWFEIVDNSQFRMLIPEYYAASCLSCHGEPAGEVDITGFPKEGGKEGELGGAISITLLDPK